MMIQAKRCGQCRKLQDVANFRPRIKGGNVLQSYCKKCMDQRSKEWQIKNHDKFISYQRNYNVKCQQKCKQ
jgi:hypothetical protein